MEPKQDERDLIETLVKQNLKAYDDGVDLACDFIIEAMTERNKIMWTSYDIINLIRKVQQASKDHSKMKGS